VKPDGLLAKAERALASADLLLSAGDPEGACNRAYYAMFDSARAALLQIAPDFVEIRTHGGLISAFSQHLVKPGHIPVELGKAINATEDMRVAADYKSEPINLDNAAWAVAEAHRFVVAVRWLVSRNDKA
jgi:uncharacterized protein (UPF0332 family)